MNLTKERQVKACGFDTIAGLDEVGRGAWAGPLIAAAVVLDPGISLNSRLGRSLKEVRDSKMLRADKREAMFNFLTCNFSWAVGRVEPEEISLCGLTQANKTALARAVSNLDCAPDYLLIDYWENIDYALPGEGIEKGDQLVMSIAAASVVAKVYRDRLMINYHQVLSAWRFDRHKGYGTRLHQDRLRQYGISRIHRLNFSPVKKFKI